MAPSRNDRPDVISGIAKGPNTAPITNNRWGQGGGSGAPGKPAVDPAESARLALLEKERVMKEELKKIEEEKSRLEREIREKKDKDREEEGRRREEEEKVRRDRDRERERERDRERERERERERDRNGDRGFDRPRVRFGLGSYDKCRGTDDLRRDLWTVALGDHHLEVLLHGHSCPGLIDLHLGSLDLPYLVVGVHHLLLDSDHHPGIGTGIGIGGIGMF
jgi:hypothetical protein